MPSKKYAIAAQNANIALRYSATNRDKRISVSKGIAAMQNVIDRYERTLEELMQVQQHERGDAP